MRTILLFFLILGFAISVSAQPFGNPATGYYLKRMDYESSSGEKGFTSFRYNSEGKLVKALWSLEDGSRFSNNFYQNDENGNIVSAFREFSDGLTSHEIFIFNNSDKKTEEHFFRSDSVSGSAFYEYTGLQLSKMECKNFKGWLTATIHYTYNNKSQLETGSIKTGDKEVGNISYEYDALGNLVKEHWDFGGRWSQTFTYIYEKKGIGKNYYSSPYLVCPADYRISKEFYSFNNESSGPSYYYYSDNGSLEKKRFVRSDSLFTDTKYIYDNRKRLILSERKYSDGDEATFQYKYDTNNNLIERYFSRGDTLFGFESYLFNSNDELTKAYLKNFDGWLTGTICYKTNILGQLDEGEFKGENGFDAIINFKYNKRGLLNEITWNFSFGKFQKYVFEYEPVGNSGF